MQALRRTSLLWKTKSSCSWCHTSNDGSSMYAALMNIHTLVIADGGEGTKSAIQAARNIVQTVPSAVDSHIDVLVAGDGHMRERYKEMMQMVSLGQQIPMRMVVADDEMYRHTNIPEPYALLIEWMQKRFSYTHIIAASTSFGKDIIPRAAAMLMTEPINDVIEIKDEKTFVRPIYAGNALETVRWEGSGVLMLTVRPSAFPVNDGRSTHNDDRVGYGQQNTSSTYDIYEIPKEDLRQHMLFKETYRCSAMVCASATDSHDDAGMPDLQRASIVVAGGRAFKSKENFERLHTFARRVGAAVGATRAAVDAGYVSNDAQIGQTGKVIAPDVYIAFGISGAIQHIAGMKDSKIIISINRDPEAPIFQVSDYVLVGDVFEVLDALNE